MKTHSKFIFNVFALLALLGSLIVGSAATVTPAHAAALYADIVGPAGSEKFGTYITVLPNGNFVVVDPLYDTPAPGPVQDVGAVYLYNGATHALISTLTGSSTYDRVGYGGIIVLANGNYLVRSHLWDNAGNADAGAITWSSETTGVNGTVSAANSLVGSRNQDSLGSGGILALTNGNYVVASPSWDNFPAADVGAVTWGNGKSGTAGTISSANSLTGSISNDNVGSSLTALTNSNYVVASPNWNSAKGAITWGNGTTGVFGVVSASNSLVGSTNGDQVGTVTALTNGNYVVASPGWDGAGVDVGAVTWGNGLGGTVGAVIAVPSLFGSTTGDNISNGGVKALTNGNYVFRSPIWDGAVADAGAVTWGSGAGSTNSIVSASNSLVGSTAGDLYNSGITALTNGNYVVASPGWDGVVADLGAVTWGDGLGTTVGTIASAKTMFGSTTSDSIGNGGVTVLTNGNYVVRSPIWDGAVADAGSVTWGSGIGTGVGAISAANSLVGSTAGDLYSSSVTALTNGNYVVASPLWDGSAADVGAATWCNGLGSTVGAISYAKSLVGSTADDEVGLSGITPLTNGNYVAASPLWDGIVADAGAATWGNGLGGTVGIVSTTNSLVGSTSDIVTGHVRVTALSNGNYVVTLLNPASIYYAGSTTWGSGTGGTAGIVSAAGSLIGSTSGDMVGNDGVTILTSGNYVIKSTVWDGAAVNSGAVTLGTNLGKQIVGVITANNSVLGSSANGGNAMNFQYDYINDQLVVGRPADNIVTLFKYTPPSVTSIVCVTPNPTNLSSVDFTVNFSESVTGVDTGDFTLTTTGVSGAAVSGVSGSGSIYTVTVSTGTGNGTIRLDVLNNGTIVNAALNPLGAGFTGGETYIITKVFNLFLPLILR